VAEEGNKTKLFLAVCHFRLRNADVLADVTRNILANVLSLRNNLVRTLKTPQIWDEVYFEFI
jgi:hypothetical protein